MSSFKKASELLNSSNDTVTINELKGRLTHLENNQLSEIHKSLSKSSNKETFDRPCIETLQKYVSSAKPKNTNKNTRLWVSRFESFVNDTQPNIDLMTLYDKKAIAMLLCEFIIVIQTKDKKEYKANSLYNGICAINRFYQEIFKDREPFNIHEDFEFRIVRDTLHTRMIELEEINNGEYNGADPLTDEEMVKIFEHPDISSNSPDGLLRRVFLWVDCCTARRGGSYHSIMASHFKKRDDGGYNIVTIHDKTHQGGYYHQTNSNQQPVHIIPPDEPGTYGACHDIRKYLSLRPNNAEENFFLRINKDIKENWYSTFHLGLDSQAIMNVTLHWSIAGLNAYRTQNEKQKLDIAKLTLPGISKDILMQENLEKSAEDLNTEQRIENLSSQEETKTEPFTEIQNITIPLKRKDDLIDNFRLKFVKCSNFTINITK
ncbi:zinc finger MYM-type protein 2-like [Rhizophagus clarus]|uniref:Zinc finger MYM-type protein 2-like n=2 Tax=Rhizophagus clarus TaxID=94130 RepID=A0A8H3MDS6_9GLOM|nr:zinc finger MYM-type protein 2-like [Rhizophagus clarus]